MATHNPTRNWAVDGRRVVRIAVAVGAATLLASCVGAPGETPTSKVQFSEADYGVPASPRMVGSGRDVPEGGGRYMVGKPYRVAGKTYVPRENPNYSAVGLASWYGSNFHGRKTANGEVYDMHDLTAAHPTLPLPSYARVTNMSNGRSVVVRVNDRGPFKRGRILDVSSTVADVLDFKRAGTARVKVDYVGPARLEGHDREYLLASYSVRGRNAPSSPTMVALASPPTRTRPAYAAAPSTPSARNVDFGFASEPVPSALMNADPLGPFILKTTFSSSYLPTDRFTKAQQAAAALVAGEAVDEAPAVVQLGAFADPANARRIAASFARYGAVVATNRTVSAGSVTVIRIAVADDQSPADVIAAARAAGLRGAFVVGP